MDLLVVLLIVGGVAFWLSLRAYRIFRRADSVSESDDARCSNGCAACANDNKSNDSDDRL